MEQFLGKPVSYWVELDRDISLKGKKYEEMLEEIIRLRGKISYYESQIQDIADLLK